ncbi:LysR family transcriptional regulator [Pseudomonas matsuisoli]|uniref:LysR family transcriptional regulator n=1 Tax=Pseudomonas matsuisoli TaxID=1515666 RepID=A0A917PZW9_9PSED|nr:LysR family transcriptional regulator [Pseudomonas matsuisoli]GGK02806.1 LysR family transcriptional regulator [Pseudomonas matsuisoli]
MKITLDEMQAFVRVVESGSISAAAAQLDQTASAISRSLSRLEHKLAVTLLRRTTRRLELTEEGDVFLGQARGILASVEDAEEHMALRTQQPSGLLRVNAASVFVLHVLIPLMRGFRERYPQIELELNSNEQYIDLLEERTDLAIRIGPLRDSTLHARALGSSRIRVLASPDYLQRHGVPMTVEDLANHHLIGFTGLENLNSWPLRHAHGDSYTISPVIKASSGETVRQLALAGSGIVCLTDFMTQDDREQGALMEILTEHTLESRQPIHAVYYRNTALASRISCFLDYLSDAMLGQPWAER